MRSFSSPYLILAVKDTYNFNRKKSFKIIIACCVLESFNVYTLMHQLDSCYTHFLFIFT